MNKGLANLVLALKKRTHKYPEIWRDACDDAGVCHVCNWSHESCTCPICWRCKDTELTEHSCSDCYPILGDSLKMSWCPKTEILQLNFGEIDSCLDESKEENNSWSSIVICPDLANQDGWDISGIPGEFLGHENENHASIFALTKKHSPKGFDTNEILCSNILWFSATRTFGDESHIIHIAPHPSATSAEDVPIVNLKNTSMMIFPMVILSGQCKFNWHTSFKNVMQTQQQRRRISHSGYHVRLFPKRKKKLKPLSLMKGGMLDTTIEEL